MIKNRRVLQILWFRNLTFAKVFLGVISPQANLLEEWGPCLIIIIFLLILNRPFSWSDCQLLEACTSVAPAEVFTSMSPDVLTGRQIRLIRWFRMQRGSSWFSNQKKKVQVVHLGVRCNLDNHREAYVKRKPLCGKYQC